MNTTKALRNLMLSGLAVISLATSSCSSGSSSQSSNSQLQDKLQQISQSYLNTYSASTHVSALPILAQCGNQQPIAIYNGNMAYSESKTINSNTLFQIGSITKSFASVVLLQLAAESQYNYNLDQPIGQWLENIPHQWQTITTRQLMHMVSGIPNYTDDESFITTYVFNTPYDYHPIDFFALSQAGYPVLFAPGAEYKYSNTNYALMGMLIETITEKSVYDEISSRIIKRLGLQNTYFPIDLPEMVVSPERLVAGYFMPESTIIDTRLWSLAWANSAGGIISNISDINTYVNSLFNPGELLNAQQISELTTLVSMKTGQPISSVSTNDPTGFGLGVVAAYLLKRQIYTYTGSTFGFKFTYYYDPMTKNIAVYTINVGSGMDQTNESAARTYERIGYDILNYLESNCIIN